MTTVRNVHLLVPGLLGPLPETARGAVSELERLTDTEYLLGRGARFSAAGSDTLALARAAGGLPELPAGALGFLGVEGNPGNDWWMRADPIHLRPDRDRLLVFAGRGVRPNAEETRALLREFNALFVDDGMELMDRDGYWFLRTRDETPAGLASTRELAGRYFDQFLPTGSDGRRWRAFLNETQMLFFGNAVNQEREAAGELPLNGLWAWGGGRLSATIAMDFDLVVADEPTLRGLARNSGVRAEKGVDRFSQLPLKDASNVLAVWEGCQEALLGGDLHQWLDALIAFERSWAREARAALANGTIDRLYLYAGNGHGWSIGRGDRWKRWRRIRPLRRWLDLA